MDRREFALMTVAVLASPGVVMAQSAKKVWKVGYLSMRSAAADKYWVAAELAAGLRDAADPYSSTKT